MPSTLMEYFASDPRVLQSIGRHYKTGEKLPLDTLERYCAARKIFAGVDLQMQTFYSIMDQVYPLKRRDLKFIKFWVGGVRYLRWEITKNVLIILLGLSWETPVKRINN